LTTAPELWWECSSEPWFDEEPGCPGTKASQSAPAVVLQGALATRVPLPVAPRDLTPPPRVLNDPKPKAPTPPHLETFAETERRWAAERRAADDRRLGFGKAAPKGLIPPPPDRPAPVSKFAPAEPFLAEEPVGPVRPPGAGCVLSVGGGIATTGLAETLATSSPAAVGAVTSPPAMVKTSLAETETEKLAREIVEGVAAMAAKCPPGDPRRWQKAVEEDSASAVESDYGHIQPGDVNVPVFIAKTRRGSDSGWPPFSRGRTCYGFETVSPVKGRGSTPAIRGAPRNARRHAGYNTPPCVSTRAAGSSRASLDFAPCWQCLEGALEGMESHTRDHLRAATEAEAPLRDEFLTAQVTQPDSNRLRDDR
jgi:hypothetical protein